MQMAYESNLEGTGALGGHQESRGHMPTRGAWMCGLHTRGPRGKAGKLHVRSSKSQPQP